VDEALRELDACRRILPRDAKLVERFVPALVAAGKREAADALFDEVIAAQEKICSEWPRAASHHNAIAWTSARCQRRLDEALDHALTATKLRPSDAAFVDTLAEVYFVRGDVTKAIETQRRAVKLAPQSPLFQTRLKEFEAAERGERVERSFHASKDEV
jgi:tetratricopeptide (TPR) repeat protein